MNKPKIVVAMSGGVDSSVAAMLLKDQDAVGVSMQVWDYRQHGGCDSRATCCAPDDFTDARRVAAKVGIPYYVFDFEQSFREKVIDTFVDTYKAGKTPNPCIDCNSKVKFAELRKRAASLGCDFVATGHYARIEKRDDGYHLLRGVDPAKDQSYFLYGLTQAELSKTLFPVGHMTKPEVREIARQAGLVTAEKPESQDICFVSGSLGDFLVKIGVKPRIGNIVNQEGQVLGQHQGLHNHTVGQRRGLALGGSAEGLYVLELQPETNTIVVGPKKALERQSFKVHKLNWCSPDLSPPKQMKAGDCLECLAQLRHRHQAVPVKLIFENDECAQVFFQGEWTTVTPGQAAVFYSLDNQELLGGGRII